VTPVQALHGLLDDLAVELWDITPQAYAARPFEGVSGSIGAHVRHVLDHITALLHAGYPAVLSYDHRERGTAIEVDPAAAVGQILLLKTALEQFAGRDLGEPVQVLSTVSSGATVAGWSTLARELAFVVSHTIHHQAMIALLLAFDGATVAEGFGYAPTTPRA
jgi:uncharacterized damage-inducible protein DinB